MMLGDYIDQGPDSYLTVRKLFNNIGRGPVAVARLTLVADPTIILLQHLQTFTRRISNNRFNQGGHSQWQSWQGRCSCKDAVVRGVLCNSTWPPRCCRSWGLAATARNAHGQLVRLSGAFFGYSVQAQVAGSKVCDILYQMLIFPLLF